MLVDIILGVILFVFVFVLIMHCENHHLTVSQYMVHSTKLPKAFDGIRMVFLTDLHNNTFGKDNENLFRRIRNENPDYVVIGGDMLIGNATKDNSGTVSFLEKLSKEYNVYYVNGNHEQRLKEGLETRDTVYREYHNRLKRAGVRFLHNQSISLIRENESIRLTGVEIPSVYYHKIGRPQMTVDVLDECVKKSNVDKYTILLAHNPMYFEQYVNWGADLVLSGHVHGGIMRLPLLGGVISPQYILFPHFDSGKFEKDGATMLLSRGLGVHTIKIRIFNRPELISFTLKRDSL